MEKTTTAIYLDVMDLRFDPDKNGKHEAEPPIDGEPPPLARVTLPVVRPNAALQALQTELEQNKHAQAALTLQFKELGAKNERLEKAIAVLEGKA